MHSNIPQMIPLFWLFFPFMVIGLVILFQESGYALASPSSNSESVALEGRKWLW